MARRTTRKQLLKEDEFVEKATDVGQWLEEHWLAAAKVAGGILLLAAIVAVWIWNGERNARQSRLTLSAGLSLFEQAPQDGNAGTETLDAALQRFEQAADKGRGDTVRLARYYRAVTLHRLGRTEEALPLLEDLAAKAPPDTLAGAAGAILADLYVEAGRTEDAVSLLEGLAVAEGSAYPPDQALFQLGRIHEAQGELERARAVWQRIVDEFPASGTAIEARQRLDT